MKLRTVALFSAAWVVCLAPAVPASTAPGRAFRHDNVVILKAPKGRAIDVRVWRDADHLITIRDANGPITPARGCLAVWSREVTCGSGAREVRIIGSSRGDDVSIAPTFDPHIGADIAGRGGNDVLSAGLSAFIDGGKGDDRITGGPGADTLSGGAGNDRIVGGDGDDIVMGDVIYASQPDAGGSDVVLGGAGDDDLLGEGWGTRHASTGDVLSGGPGTDVADYVGRGDHLRISLDGVANDGAPGEGDDVRPDIEVVEGGSGNDTLVGNAGRNDLEGNDGNDVLWGRSGTDHLNGRRGNDAIHAADGEVDRVICSDGTDAAFVDGIDSVTPSCESVTVA